MRIQNSEREKYYYLIMKLNSFEMFAHHESANDMYPRLNVLVEEVNRLGLTQLSRFDVVDKILSVFLIEKYGHIITMLLLHQVNISVTTLITQIRVKINVREMYMHIAPQYSSSCNNKKYFEFKANQMKKGKHNQGRRNLSEKECDDVSIALIVRKTTKVVKMFNK